MSRSRKHNRYYKSRAFDKSCRCHGACDWCRGNRQAAVKRQEAAADINLWIGDTLQPDAQPYWVRSLRHG